MKVFILQIRKALNHRRSFGVSENVGDTSVCNKIYVYKYNEV